MLIFRHQKFDADPHKKRCAYHLEEGQIKQHDGKGNENHAQRNGAKRPPEHALQTLFMR